MNFSETFAPFRRLLYSVVGFGLYPGAPDPCIADCGAGDTALEFSDE